RQVVNVSAGAVYQHSGISDDQGGIARFQHFGQSGRRRMIDGGEAIEFAENDLNECSRSSRRSVQGDAPDTVYRRSRNQQHAAHLPARGHAHIGYDPESRNPLVFYNGDQRGIGPSFAKQVGATGWSGVREELASVLLLSTYEAETKGCRVQVTRRRDKWHGHR